MVPPVEEKPYEYLGVQALPPRQHGRNHRRGKKEENETVVNNNDNTTQEQEQEDILNDAFYPYVEEFSF